MRWSPGLRRSITDSAIILSRIDYAEKDRILTIITQNHGKLSAIAKAVRTPKSKLAGGIELFAENTLMLIEGRGELYTVASSRMKKYFGGISQDIDKSMYAYECFKAVNKLTPDGAGEEYYQPLLKLLEALDEGEVPLVQINIWFGLKVLENLGSSPNLNMESKGSISGSKGLKYDFDKHYFFEKPDGSYGADHVKILRHLSKARKPVEIKGADEKLSDSVARLVNLLLNEHIK